MVHLKNKKEMMLFYLPPKKQLSENVKSEYQRGFATLFRKQYTGENVYA